MRAKEYYINAGRYSSVQSNILYDTHYTTESFIVEQKQAVSPGGRHGGRGVLGLRGTHMRPLARP